MNIFRIINSTLIIIAGMLILASCNENRDVAPIRSLDNKANITITRIDGGTNNEISEGDTLRLLVSSDKFLTFNVGFNAIFKEASQLEEGWDYEVISGGTLVAYTKTMIAEIVIIEDNFPETDELLVFDYYANDVNTNWQLHPNSTVPTSFNITVKNVNVAGAVTVGFRWEDDHDDYDMYIISGESDEVWGGEEESDAATGNFPEITSALKVSDPDGVYYVGIDPYELVNPKTEYTIAVGFEDGSSQVFTGTFDSENTDGYSVDAGFAYRLLRIEKNGSNFTVTHVNQ